MSDSDSNVFDLKGVRLVRGTTVILDRLDWRVRRGEHWAVVGANGSGKTTMLKVATGAMWPTEGEVRGLGHLYGTVDLRELRKRFGWVSSALDEWLPPHDTALRIVLSGRFATYGLYEEATADDLRRAGELLTFVGCEQIAERPYRVLSQGERQRVLLARGLMPEADVLILDEVCAGLDVAAREMILSAVEKLTCDPDGPTVILVTHHIEEIVPGITHALALKDGGVFASGAKDNVLRSETLSQAFGVPLEVDRHNGRYWTRVRHS